MPLWRNTGFVPVTGNTEPLWPSTDPLLHLPEQPRITVIHMIKYGTHRLNGYEYRSTNTLSNLGALALSQNIGWTGGTIALNSDFTMFNDYENSANKKYITTPLSISLTQPLFRYNPLKWQKKTEPLKYRQPNRHSFQILKSVHSRAVMNFFSLALAQINKQIAEMNYSNADTL